MWNRILWCFRDQREWFECFVAITQGQTICASTLERCQINGERSLGTHFIKTPRMPYGDQASLWTTQNPSRVNRIMPTEEKTAHLVHHSMCWRGNGRVIKNQTKKKAQVYTQTIKTVQYRSKTKEMEASTKIRQRLTEFILSPGFSELVEKHFGYHLSVLDVEESRAGASVQGLWVSKVSYTYQNCRRNARSKGDGFGT